MGFDMALPHTCDFMVESPVTVTYVRLPSKQESRKKSQFHGDFFEPRFLNSIGKDKRLPSRMIKDAIFRVFCILFCFYAFFYKLRDFSCNAAVVMLQRYANARHLQRLF